MCTQVLPDAGQELPRVRQKPVDLVPRERDLRAVIHGLAVQEGVVQPPREFLAEQRGLYVYLVELCDRAIPLRSRRDSLSANLRHQGAR